jgi:hypothetical protein
MSRPDAFLSRILTRVFYFRSEYDRGVNTFSPEVSLIFRFQSYRNNGAGLVLLLLRVDFIKVNFEGTLRAKEDTDAVLLE